MPARKKTPSQSATNSADDSKSLNFEDSLAELETIVLRMEQSEQPLQQTLKDFERGMVLSEQCQKSLESAQQRVDILVEKHGAYKLQPMESLDDDAELEE